jgi:hypothetical protein
LVEVSHRDRNWGIGYSERNALRMQVSRMLMRVRARLLQQADVEAEAEAGAAASYSVSSSFNPFAPAVSSGNSGGNPNRVPTQDEHFWYSVGGLSVGNKDVVMRRRNAANYVVLRGSRCGVCGHGCSVYTVRCDRST